MNHDFPCLLVATEFPPNSSGGGPAVVRQMLKDWPVERLQWWSCLPERDDRFGRKVATHRVAAIPAKLYPHRRLRLGKSWILEKVWRPWAASHFQETLRLLRPDVIWIIPHAWAISPLAEVLLDEGTGFHVTVQDFSDSESWVRQFGIHQSRRMATLADQLYAAATTRDATSHPMIADLQERTGTPAAQMMHAGLEPEDFDYLAGKKSTPPGTIKIAFAGTVTVEAPFELFVDAVATIRHRLSRPISLELFGAHSFRDRNWFDPSWMHKHGNLPEPELTTALRQCTWGFSLMSLSEDDPRHRFSFPTKFISYLAAGLPIITLGHRASSVVQMAKEYVVGVCLTSTDPAALQEKLGEIFEIENPWQVFGAEIVRCARAEFDASEKRRLLYDCFRQCAAETRGEF